MEIDFLGLNSCKTTQDSSSSQGNLCIWNNNGGVETSLSLSSTSSVTHQKKKWELGGDEKGIFNPLCNEGLSHYTHGSFPVSPQPGLVLLSTPVFTPSPSLVYDLIKNNHSNARNVSKFSSDQNSVKRFYSNRPPANKPTYASAIGISGEARMKSRGHTPTVAMARKASLARFLEKRLHRMNQTRPPHLTGKPVLNTESNHTKTRHDNININIQL